MEAIERAVATQPACGTITARRLFLELSGERCHTLDSFLAAHAQPILADEPVVWTKAVDLTTHMAAWVPFEAVSFDRTSGSSRYWQSSDGLASGNTWKEAVLHGLLERVERDALTLWAITGTSKRYRRKLILNVPDNAPLSDLVQRIEEAGLVIGVFDITTDIAIPCVAALLAPADWKAQGPMLRHVDVTLGAGASTDPEVSAIRAITEAVQSRMTFIAGARDDLLPQIYQRPPDESTSQAFNALPSLQLSSLPKIDVQNIDDALQATVERLAARNIEELYAVELAPPRLPASVVKVLAPQLESPDGERRLRYGTRAISKALT